VSRYFSIVAATTIVSVLVSACREPYVPSPAEEWSSEEQEALADQLSDQSARDREVQLQGEPEDDDAELPETFASAHRFISKLVANGGVTIESETGRDWNVGCSWQNPLKGPESRLVAHAFPPTAILGASDDGECGSLFRVESMEAIRFGREGERVVISPPFAWRYPFVMNWTKVRAVTQYGREVLVAGPHQAKHVPACTYGPSRLKLRFRTENEATVMAYVLEFLHLYCQEES